MSLVIYQHSWSVYMGCDFSALAADSELSEEKKQLLMVYGAIFTDEDERRWNEAVADANGDLEDDNEPENPPQP